MLKLWLKTVPQRKIAVPIIDKTYDDFLASSPYSLEMGQHAWVKSVKMSPQRYRQVMSDERRQLLAFITTRFA
ncbi:MAG TPA: hypothetical protein DIS81_05335 [Psychrobacter sp.]|nr:hypothetical protein [Psychrobacter sp.]